MTSVWDSVKAGATAAAVAAADATKIAAQKTKLKADIVLCDRDMNNCKKAFGVSMYEHISPLSQTAEFYAADDELTQILRPALIKAQKEIQALAAKRVSMKENLAAAETRRAGAFPTPAETAGEKVRNFGKASAMHSNEAKIKAEISMLDARIKGYKQDFGLNLFAILVEAEDNRGYLPSDRQVRSIYDQTRQDINKIVAKKERKVQEIRALGSGNAPAYEGPDVPPTAEQRLQQQRTASSNQQKDPDLLML